MNTTEKNKLINVFVHGAETPNHNRWHDDWNELMFLVQKITTTPEFQNDYPDNSIFWDAYNSIDKEETFEACIEFIEWFNNQKK